MDKYNEIRDSIVKAGLYSLGWYLSWEIGQKEATLDGDFTSTQLRQIADYMDETKQREE